jgi:pimeloyl-ACP methyl ester carboxylesterase
MARRSLVESARRLASEVACVSRDKTPASAYAPLGPRLTLLRGSHSPVAARLIAGRIAAAVPGSTLVEAAAAGHMTPVLEPDAIANVILSTLKPAAT